MLALWQKDVYGLNKTNSESIVIREVEKLLDAGLVNKNEIINKVVEATGVPRPTVRRIMRDLRNKMLRKVKILQTDL